MPKWYEFFFDSDEEEHFYVDYGAIRRKQEQDRLAAERQKQEQQRLDEERRKQEEDHKYQLIRESLKRENEQYWEKRKLNEQELERRVEEYRKKFLLEQEENRKKFEEAKIRSKKLTDIIVKLRENAKKLNDEIKSSIELKEAREKANEKVLIEQKEFAAKKEEGHLKRDAEAKSLRKELEDLEHQFTVASNRSKQSLEASNPPSKNLLKLRENIAKLKEGAKKLNDEIKSSIELRKARDCICS